MNSGMADLYQKKVDDCAEMEVRMHREIETLKAEVELLRKDAERYRYLRDRDLATIHQGGIFAGLTPDNVVVNGDHLDRYIDAAMEGE